MSLLVRRALPSASRPPKGEVVGVNSGPTARLGIERTLLVRDAASSSGARAGRSPFALTERETQILKLVAAGQANKEIAHVLRISPHTVERHIANVYGKISAKNRAEATAWALAHGLAST